MIKPAKFREIIDEKLVFQICWRVFKRNRDVTCIAELL